MDNNQNQNVQVDPIVERPTPVEAPRGQAISSMVFGILSIVLGCYPLIGILGIIFGAIAGKRAKAFLRDYPESGARGFANAGRITGKIGLILSIVLLCIYVFSFGIGILAGILSAMG